MRFNVVIPTFEPYLEESINNRQLLEFYEKNFESWIGATSDSAQINLILCDFKSSQCYRDFLLKFAEDRNNVKVIFGDERLSSVEALNEGIVSDKSADIYVYAASDSAAASKDWPNTVLSEFSDNARTSVLYSTSKIGGSRAGDTIQNGYKDQEAKILRILT